jgi:ubiquinone/menaquinone biosynthesis C-methylase UbiE
MTDKSRLQQHYDSVYAQAGLAQVQPVRIEGYPRDRHQMAVHLAQRHPGGRLLEVGAGAGNTILSLLEKYDEIVALELSTPRAEAMQEMFARISGKVKIVACDVEQGTEFADASFDCIIINAVIEHLIDPVAVLRELRRILKPGGAAIVGTPNFAKWSRRIKLLFGYFPSTASRDEGLRCYDGASTELYDHGHLHYFTYRSLSRVCKERAGFSRVVRYGQGGFLARAWPALCSGEIFIVAYK